MAKALMAAAGLSKGFSVKLSTFSTPHDFQQISSVIKSQLKAINIDVEIVAQEAGTFAANNGIGNFDWDLTGRGMRGDVDGYLNEYHPADAVFKVWYPLWKDQKVWRESATAGSSSTRPSGSRSTRTPRGAPDRPPQIRSCDQQVPGRHKRVQGMYVAFATSTRGSATRVARLVTAPRPLGREGRASAAPSRLRRTGKAVGGYVLKRILFMIPTLLGISIGIFLMVRLLPGDIIDVLSAATVRPTRRSRSRPVSSSV